MLTLEDWERQANASPEKGRGRLSRCRAIFSSARSIAEKMKLVKASGNRIMQRVRGQILNVPAGAINRRCKETK